MKRGDLGKLLRDKKCLEVEWLKRGRQIVTGVAEGLYFLHSQARPIVHRDVRAVEPYANDSSHLPSSSPPTCLSTRVGCQRLLT